MNYLSASCDPVKVAHRLRTNETTVHNFLPSSIFEEGRWTSTLIRKSQLLLESGFDRKSKLSKRWRIFARDSQYRLQKPCKQGINTIESLSDEASGNLSTNRLYKSCLTTNVFYYCRIYQNQGFSVQILLKDFYYCRNNQKQGFSVHINLIKIFLVLQE